jgi:hypothetical protein
MVETPSCSQKPLNYHVLYRPQRVEAFEILPGE